MNGNAKLIPDEDRDRGDVGADVPPDHEQGAEQAEDRAGCADHPRGGGEERDRDGAAQPADQVEGEEAGVAEERLETSPDHPTAPAC